MNHILKIEIASRNLTLKQFASEMGVSKVTICKWMNGEGLALSDFLRMINFLHLTLPEVVSRLESEAIENYTYTLE